jgi:methyl-accepting chemotaxis protein
MNPLHLAERLNTWLGRRRVGQLMLMVILPPLLLLAAQGGLSFRALAAENERAQTLAHRWVQGVRLVAESRTALLGARDFEVKHSRTEDRSYHEEYESKFKESRATLERDLQAYRALSTPPSEAHDKLLAALGKSLDEYAKFSANVLKEGRAGAHQDAKDISDGAAATSFDDSTVALDRLLAWNFEQAAAAAEAAATANRRAGGLIGAFIAGALLVSGLTGWFISRALRRRLGGEPTEAVHLARGVAAGDLAHEVRLRPGDETSLMAVLQQMQQSLSDTVRQVRTAAESVAHASAEIASANQDLSQRTEQQASALEETAASMEQLGSTVAQNAENAGNADRLAQAASALAAEGGREVRALIDTMQGIQASSSKIADIIGVIDSIAFQTNILALNAAVEAARAGEAGRGFAVVASEVRQLAQRSAEAAKEIKSLISASVEQVERGSQQVDRAGAKVQEIVGGVQRVTTLMSEISSASAQQRGGMQQVGEAVSEMDRMTQQNAALVEQSAAAAESLRQRAEELVAAMAVFKLDAR